MRVWRVDISTKRRIRIGALEFFLSPALRPVGLFSKTVCGVKSHCGSWMENADLQPASFFNTTLQDF